MQQPGLTLGDRLGPYELIARIGAGGMGEVWRARDTRLGRDVAIKMLPPVFAADDELRQRFEREARTIALLSHPNICTLFDVGDGYLVMELLEGEPLDERIARGPMPLEDVLRYGAQIAEGLDRAHRAGVVHRDLKPGNVMITRSGAKLLDFGLAKPLPARAGEPARNPAEKALTETGMVVGTLQYMAPEQLQGREVDARTDLFALGATLYEMLTGKPAFEGHPRAMLIAAILAARPQQRLSEIQPQTPAALEHVISKCLSRDPDDRWQSASDVAGELRWIGQFTSLGVPQAMTPRKSHAAWWIAGLLFVMAAAGGWLVMRPRPRADVIEAGIAMAENLGLSFNGPPALSPNGKVLAYLGRDLNGRQRIWLRAMDRGSTLTLAGAEDAAFAAWSPDARFLAFATAGGYLKKIPAGGGTAETLAQRVSVGGGVTWGRDDVLLFLGADAGSPIYRIGAAGGERSVVLAPASIGATTLLLPSFLPDGKRFLVLALGGAAEKRGESGIWVATLDGSEKPRLLARGSSNAIYVDPGFLLFVRDGELRAQRFDEQDLRVTGPAMSIAPVRSFGSIGFFTASSSGLLVYQPPESFHLSELTVKNDRGEVLRTLGRPETYRNPRVAPDGRKAAVEIVDERGNADIWIFGNDGSSRFTFEAQHEGSPVWSPRGDEIVYSIDIPPAGCAVLRKRIGEKAHTLVTLQQGCIDPSGWSPDGRYVAITRYGVKPDYDATVWSIDARKFIDVAATPAKEGAPVFSPDGRWVAYESDETGRNEIYVQPFPMTGAKEQVSSAGGSAPHWSRTGRLSWVAGNSRLTVVSTATSPSFRATRPEALFPVDHIAFWPQYDLMPDGTFLTNVLLRGQAKPMTVVVNWTERLDSSK
ncbi:MAG TPA: protein kinase [Thermoanaerobaculia bacterium]|nr:protein kinase [Thermoanaerobaculia bacterium]